MRRLLSADRVIRLLLACALIASFFMAPKRVSAAIFAAGHLLRCAVERIAASKQAAPNRRDGVLSRFIRTASDLGMLLFSSRTIPSDLSGRSGRPERRDFYRGQSHRIGARSRRWAGLIYYDRLFSNCVSLVCFFALLLPAAAASAALLVTAVVCVLLLPSLWSIIAFNCRLMKEEP